MQTVTLTELKQNLGTFVNQASFSGERIILLSHGKEKAALISMQDLRVLEAIKKEEEKTQYVSQQQNLLNEAQVLREKMGAADYQVDSVADLEEARGERLDDIMGLR